MAVLPAAESVSVAGHPQAVGPNPTGLQPHFGSEAVAEAVQPLTSLLAQQLNISELRLDLSGLQALAAAASRGGQGVLEVQPQIVPHCGHQYLSSCPLACCLANDVIRMLHHLQLR